MVHATATFEKDHHGFRVFPGRHVRLQETLRKMPRRLRLLHRRPARFRGKMNWIDANKLQFPNEEINPKQPLRA